MIFCGKQIRITLESGELVIFRGSAFSLHVAQFQNYGWVTVYNQNGDDIWNRHSSEIKEVIEDNYGRESLK